MQTAPNSNLDLELQYLIFQMMFALSIGVILYCVLRVNERKSQDVVKQKKTVDEETSRYISWYHGGKANITPFQNNHSSATVNANLSITNRHV